MAEYCAHTAELPSYSELAPWPAERVLRLETAICHPEGEDFLA